MDEAEKKITESRTLGRDGIITITGCLGALVGFIVPPWFTLQWLIADFNKTPGEVGFLTIPLFMAAAAIVGVPTGALTCRIIASLVCRIIAAIKKRKVQKRRQQNSN